MNICINKQISAKQIRVLDDEGNLLGILPFSEGLKLAEQAGKDLIEIAPTANPPVCKIIEYGKFLYEQKKAIKPQKTPELKEFRFNVNIAIHDLQTKSAQIYKLLEKGHPIRIIVRFHGREIAHQDNGYIVINTLKLLLKEFVFNEIKQEEKQLVTMIRPK